MEFRYRFLSILNEHEKVFLFFSQKTVQFHALFLEWSFSSSSNVSNDITSDILKMEWLYLIPNVSDFTALKILIDTKKHSF